MNLDFFYEIFYNDVQYVIITSLIFWPILIKIA